MSTPTQPLSALTEDRPAEPSRKKMVVRVVLLAALFGAGVYGFTAFQRMTEFEVTDDAAASADVVQVSAQLNGTVAEIFVNDNDSVKKGQLLATLDDSRVKIIVQQAQANLDVALADAKGAGADVRLATKTTAADQAQAAGGVEQADGGIGMAQAAIAKARADLQAARNGENVAKNDVRSALLESQTARLNVQRAEQDVVSATAALDNATNSVRSAELSIRAAESHASEAKKELARQQRLRDEGAVSGRQAELAENASNDAIAALEAARHQLDTAQTAVRQRTADLESARVRSKAAEAAVRDSDIHVQSARIKSESAHVNIAATASNLGSASRNLEVASGKRRQSNGQLLSARAEEERVSLKLAGESQALAKVEMARSALDSAKLDLAHTRIYAPTDGRIARRTIQVGSLVQNGTGTMTLVPNGSLYFIANFKETQLAHIEPGQVVDIEADGFPNHVFKGRVNSTSAATGSTFALLPADNATGNFVKVVQRIPVKITLDDKNGTAMARLRVGMSATVKVHVK